MGLNMKEKQAVTGEYIPRYQKASKKEKKALLDEFTKLTGYHRKSAVRLLGAKPVKQVMVYVDGKPVKVKPQKKRPANRKGKRIYSDEVIDALRLVWTFFSLQMRENPRSVYEAADVVHSPMAGLSYNKGHCRKTEKDKPGNHRPIPEKRQTSPEAEREKPHKTHRFP
jgi:hypothetical protein